jgi:hypothetical protein
MPRQAAYNAQNDRTADNSQPFCPFRERTRDATRPRDKRPFYFGEGYKSRDSRGRSRQVRLIARYDRVPLIAACSRM